MMSVHQKKSLAKGHKSEVIGAASSSDLSEDDIPLNARLTNFETRDGKESGKDERPKKAGFIIPRKKKQTSGLLLAESFNSREGKELVRNVQQLFRDPDVGSAFKFEKLEFVQNEKLSREFQEKKQAMRNEQRNVKELEEKLAFLYTTDKREARRICQLGLVIGSSSMCCLGDPQMGVYLCRHADIIARKNLGPSSSGILIVFKILKGKVKTVTERGSHVLELLEPTPNFDCHVSKTVQNLTSRVLHSQLYESSQYYLYEFAEDGDELHAKRPRQCCPHALVTFTITSTPGIMRQLSGTAEIIGQDEVVGVRQSAEGEEQMLSSRTGNLGGSHVVWAGAMMTKGKMLAMVNLICCTNKKPRLPFEVGEKIDVRDKITNENLRKSLPLPVFKNGLPSINRACKVFISGDCYLCCEVSPVTDGGGKIPKLIAHFINNQCAGLVRCHDFDRVVYLIPTSQMTHDLGITNEKSPIELHALFVKSNPTLSESMGGNICAKKPSGQEQRTEKDEARTLEKIQEQLTKRFTIKDDFRENERPVARQRKAQASQMKPRTESSKMNDRVSSDQQRLPAHSSHSAPPVQLFPVELSDKQKEESQQTVINWLSQPSPLKASEQTMEWLGGLENEQNQQQRKKEERYQGETVQQALKVVKAVHGKDPRLEKMKEQEHSRNKATSFSSMNVSAENLPETLRSSRTRGNRESAQPAKQSQSDVESTGVNLSKAPDSQLSSINIDSVQKTMENMDLLNLKETLQELDGESAGLQSGGRDTKEHKKGEGQLTHKADVSATGTKASSKNMQFVNEMESPTRESTGGKSSLMVVPREEQLSGGRRSQAHALLTWSKDNSSQAHLSSVQSRQMLTQSNVSRAPTSAPSSQVQVQGKSNTKPRSNLAEQKTPSVGSSTESNASADLKSCPGHTQDYSSKEYDSTKKDYSSKESDSSKENDSSKKKEGGPLRKMQVDTLSSTLLSLIHAQQKGCSGKEDRSKELRTENKANAAKTIVGSTSQAILASTHLTDVMKEKDGKRELVMRPVQTPRVNPVSRVIDQPGSHKASPANTKHQTSVSSTNAITVITSVGKYSNAPKLSSSEPHPFPLHLNVPPSVYNPPTAPSSVSQLMHCTSGSSSLSHPGDCSPVVPSSFKTPANIHRPAYYSTAVSSLSTIPSNKSPLVYHITAVANKSQQIYHATAVPSMSGGPPNKSQAVFHSTTVPSMSQAVFHPTAVPSMSAVPPNKSQAVFHPTAVPSMSAVPPNKSQAVFHPTAVPSMSQAVFQPTAVPSMSAVPPNKSQPVFQPTAVPSMSAVPPNKSQPVFQPTAVPSMSAVPPNKSQPVFQPTAVPSMSAVPPNKSQAVFHPTAVPSMSQAVFQPTAVPSMSAVPPNKSQAVFHSTTVPSMSQAVFHPTAVPSMSAVPPNKSQAVFHPTAVPSMSRAVFQPTAVPSMSQAVFHSTAVPSMSQPVFHATAVPSMSVVPSNKSKPAFHATAVPRMSAVPSSVRQPAQHSTAVRSSFVTSNIAQSAYQNTVLSSMSTSQPTHNNTYVPSSSSAPSNISQHAHHDTAGTSSFNAPSNIYQHAHHDTAGTSSFSAPSNISQPVCHNTAGTGSFTVPPNMSQPARHMAAVSRSLTTPPQISQPTHHNTASNIFQLGYHNTVVPSLSVMPSCTSQSPHHSTVVPSMPIGPSSMSQHRYPVSTTPSSSNFPSNILQPGYRPPVVLSSQMGVSSVQSQPGFPGPMVNPPSVQRSALSYGYTSTSHYVQQPLTNPINPLAPGQEKYPVGWPATQFPIQSPAQVTRRRFSDPSGTSVAVNSVQTPSQQFLPSAAFPNAPWQSVICPTPGLQYPNAGGPPQQDAMGRLWHMPPPSTLPPKYLYPRQPPPGYGFPVSPVQFRQPAPSQIVGVPVNKSTLPRRHSVGSGEVLKMGVSLSTTTTSRQKCNEETVERSVACLAGPSSQKAQNAKIPTKSDGQNLPKSVVSGCVDGSASVKSDWPMPREDGFLTEAEKKGSEAIKQVYGILKRNASFSPSVSKSDAEKLESKERESGQEMGKSAENQPENDKVTQLQTPSAVKKDGSKGDQQNQKGTANDAVKAKKRTRRFINKKKRRAQKREQQKQRKNQDQISSDKSTFTKKVTQGEKGSKKVTQGEKGSKKVTQGEKGSKSQTVVHVHKKREIHVSSQGIPKPDEENRVQNEHSKESKTLTEAGKSVEISEVDKDVDKSQIKRNASVTRASASLEVVTEGSSPMHSTGPNLSGSYESPMRSNLKSGFAVVMDIFSKEKDDQEDDNVDTWEVISDVSGTDESVEKGSGSPVEVSGEQVWTTAVRVCRKDDSHSPKPESVPTHEVSNQQNTSRTVLLAKESATLHVVRSAADSSSSGEIGSEEKVRRGGKRLENRLHINQEGGVPLVESAKADELGRVDKERQHQTGGVARIRVKTLSEGGDVAGSVKSTQGKGPSVGSHTSDSREGKRQRDDSVGEESPSLLMKRIKRALQIETSSGQPEGTSTHRETVDSRRVHIGTPCLGEKKLEALSQGQGHSSSPSKVSSSKKRRSHSPSAVMTIDVSPSDARQKRIVSPTSDTLKITILRECLDEDVSDEEGATTGEPTGAIVEKIKRRKCTAKKDREEKPATSLSDDLESVSTGSLPRESPESPSSPATPETASPAMDFTHPSLGFWAAPLASEEQRVVTGLAAEDTAPLSVDHFSHVLPRASEARTRRLFLQTNAPGERETLCTSRMDEPMENEEIDQIADQHFMSSSLQGSDEQPPSVIPKVYEYSHGITEHAKGSKADSTSMNYDRRPIRSPSAPRRSHRDYTDTHGDFAVRKSPSGDEGRETESGTGKKKKAEKESGTRKGIGKETGTETGSRSQNIKVGTGASTGCKKHTSVHTEELPNHSVHKCKNMLHYNNQSNRDVAEHSTKRRATGPSTRKRRLISSTDSDTEQIVDWKVRVLVKNSSPLAKREWNSKKGNAAAVKDTLDAEKKCSKQIKDGRKKRSCARLQENPSISYSTDVISSLDAESVLQKNAKTASIDASNVTTPSCVDDGGVSPLISGHVEEVEAVPTNVGERSSLRGDAELEEDGNVDLGRPSHVSDIFSNDGDTEMKCPPMGISIEAENSAIVVDMCTSRVGLNEDRGSKEEIVSSVSDICSYAGDTEPECPSMDLETEAENSAVGFEVYSHAKGDTSKEVTHVAQYLLPPDNTTPAPLPPMPHYGNYGNPWTAGPSAIAPVYTAQSYACYPYSANSSTMFPFSVPTCTPQSYQMSFQGGHSQYDSSLLSPTLPGTPSTTLPNVSSVSVPPSPEREIEISDPTQSFFGYAFPTMSPSTLLEESCDELKAPGTEDVLLSPLSKAQIQLGREVCGHHSSTVLESTTESKVSNSLMDQSMISTLIQFYSEIEEVSREDGTTKKKVGNREKNEMADSEESQSKKTLAVMAGTGEDISQYKMNLAKRGGEKERTLLLCSGVDSVSTGRTGKAEDCTGSVVRENSIIDEAEMTGASQVVEDDQHDVVFRKRSANGEENEEGAQCEKLIQTNEVNNNIKLIEADWQYVNGKPKVQGPEAVDFETQSPFASASGGTMKSTDLAKTQGSTFDHLQETDTIKTSRPSLQCDNNAASIHSAGQCEPLDTARQRLFSSMNSLRSLCEVSSVFDQIVHEAISATALSLESVVCRFSSGNGDNLMIRETGMSSGCSSAAGAKVEDCQAGKSSERDASHNVDTVSVVQRSDRSVRKRVQFVVYNPDNDKECEIAKNFMLRSGAVQVDLQDTTSLEKNALELRVYIRRKHIPYVHRLCNLFRLKMSPTVKFAIFNTLSDLTKNSRLYENIFVTGGAIIPDDHVLRTCDPVHLEALLTFMKEQSIKHQKFVWIMNIARRSYKKLTSERPLTQRSSQILDLLRQYRESGFVTILPKDYVAENISPPIQRQLQTALKQQIDLISVYRHFILLSDLDKNRPEVSWFFSRGIGVLNVANFLKTFAGETDATRLLYAASLSQNRAETRTEQQSPVTPDDETMTACSTPSSDISDSLAAVGVEERPDSTKKNPSSNADSKETGRATKRRNRHSSTERAACTRKQHKLARSHSLESGKAITETRLRILSSIRNTRESLILNRLDSAPSGSSTSKGLQLSSHFSVSSSSRPNAAVRSEREISEHPAPHVMPARIDSSPQEAARNSPSMTAELADVSRES